MSQIMQGALENSNRQPSDELHSANVITPRSFVKNYHFHSKNDNFAEIETSTLPIQYGNIQMIEASVTSVTFTNVIRTLKNDDYIIIDDITYYANTERKSQTPFSWAALLSDIIVNSRVSVITTTLELIKFTSQYPFVINDMSYNIQILCGFQKTNYVSTDFNSNNIVLAEQFGYFNSTPIFYILSNIGKDNFIQNNDGSLESYNIFMKINNSSLAALPVNYAGGEHKVSLNQSDISGNLKFTIVDANLQRLDLLIPFTITLRLRFMLQKR